MRLPLGWCGNAAIHTGLSRSLSLSPSLFLPSSNHIDLAPVHRLELKLDTKAKEGKEDMDKTHANQLSHFSLFHCQPSLQVLCETALSLKAQIGAQIGSVCPNRSRPCSPRPSRVHFVPFVP